MHVCTCGICKICTTKNTFLFWLTGMERESVESLLLLLSRHRPLTTHHERLSSNVTEMFSDLCRFLLSLCRSSEELFSGHSQEFFLLLKNIYATCSFEFSKQKLKIQFATKKSNKLNFTVFFKMGQKGTETYLKRHDNSYIHTVWNISETSISGAGFLHLSHQYTYKWQSPHGKQLQIWRNFYSTHDMLNPS